MSECFFFTLKIIEVPKARVFGKEYPSTVSSLDSCSAIPFNITWMSAGAGTIFFTGPIFKTHVQN